MIQIFPCLQVEYRDGGFVVGQDIHRPKHEDDRLTSGKQLRMAMGRLSLRQVRSRQCFWLPSFLTNARQTRVETTVVDNPTVRSPARTARRSLHAVVDDADGGTTGDRHLHQLSIQMEAKPVSVGREKRHVSAQRAVNGTRRGLVQKTNIESLRRPLTSHKSDVVSVRRDGHRRIHSHRQPVRGFEWDGGAYDAHVFGFARAHKARERDSQGDPGDEGNGSHWLSVQRHRLLRGFFGRATYFFELDANVGYVVDARLGILAQTALQ